MDILRHLYHQSYSKVMLEEVQVLRGLRNKLPSDLRATTALLDDRRASLVTIASDLDRLQDALDQQIEGKVAEARSQLLLELERLERYEREEAGLATETDRLLGPVAASSLSAVAGEFRNLVLRAEVGMFDVAWARKEAETKQVNELVQQQQQQMRELESEFSDELEEDE